jgi:hypothetical protein
LAIVSIHLRIGSPVRASVPWLVTPNAKLFLKKSTCAKTCAITSFWSTMELPSRRYAMAGLLLITIS